MWIRLSVGTELARGDMWGARAALEFRVERTYTVIEMPKSQRGGLLVISELGIRTTLKIANGTHWRSIWKREMASGSPCDDITFV